MDSDEHQKKRDQDLREPCPKCGTKSYQGGYCFRCGAFRPSKHNAREEDMDADTFMRANFGHQMQIYLAEGQLPRADEEDDEGWIDDPPTRAYGPVKYRPAVKPLKALTARQEKARERSKAKAAAEEERARKASEAEAAERAKGRLNLCSACKEFFRSNSEEVGISICPVCRNKTNSATEAHR